MNISGTWEGEYIYGDGYPETIKGSSIKFWVELVTNGTDIQGTFTDEETLHIFPQGGTLIGMHENNYLSMTQQYPCAWGFNDAGEIVIQEDQSSHLIVYEGFFDGDKFEGRWEIPLFDTEDSDEPGFSYSEITGSGSWWLQRIENAH